MKYNIFVNQGKCIEWGLNLQQGGILSLFTQLSSWAEGKEIDGEIYYYISAQKVIEELPLITDKKRTILHNINALKERGLLDHKIYNNKGFYKLSELGKEYIFDKDIQISSVQKVAYKYAKNDTPGMQKNAHNNNTSYNNINNNILSKDNIQKSEDFGDFNFSQDFKDVFFLYEKHRKEKKSKLTQTSRNQLLKKSSAVGEKIAIEKIQESIQNGRTGVFFDKEQKQKNKPKLACEDKTKDFNFFD